MQLNMPNFDNGPGQPFEPPLFTTVCHFASINGILDAFSGMGP